MLFNKGNQEMVKKKKQTTGELIYGVNPVIELLKAKNRKIISLYTTKPEPKACIKIKEFWPKYHVPIQYVSRDVLHRMAGSSDHQSIVAWVQPFGFRKKLFDPKKEPFLIVLDGIQDPRNVGAIIRSAYCMGVNGVILPQKNSAPLNAAAIKASAGLCEYMHIAQPPTAFSAVQTLQSTGYNIYVATFNGKDATTIPFKKPLCIVVGSEGFGVSKQLMEIGQKVTIPQKKADISYNASVAASLLLFLAR